MSIQKQMTRRQALTLALHWTAAGLAAPRVLRAAEAAPLRFCQANDLHYTDDGCGPFFQTLVRQLNRENADFVLLCGDLTENGTAAQFDGLKAALAGLRMPAYAAIGNHDWLKDGAHPHYDAAFPRQLNYRFDHKGWQFIGVDSTDGTRSVVDVLPETLTWLDDAVARLDANRPTVLFTHFPLAAGVPLTAKNGSAVLERFRGRNLVAVFSGHHHGYTEKKAGPTVLTTNRCCALRRHNHDKDKRKGYFVCEARGDGTLTRTFVEVAFAATQPATRPATQPAAMGASA